MAILSGNIRSFVERLTAQGIFLKAKGDKLHISAPRGALAPDDLAFIRDHKNKILDLVRSNETHAPDLPKATPLERRRLGYLQERIWSHQQMFPELSLYNLAIAWRFRGPLDADALDRAVTKVLNRHEVLRSRFSVEAGSPYLEFAKPNSFSIPRESLDSAVTDDALLRRLEALRDKPIKLNDGELFHIRLLHLASDHHVLFFAPHHIVWDGLSWDLFLEDLSAFYREETQGVDAARPALATQYADFSAYQRALMESSALEREFDHWKKYYGGDLPPLNLPSDKPRPRLFSYEGDAVVFSVAAETMARVRQLSRSHNVTSFVTFLAVWQAYLHRIAGQNDIVVGAPAEGRRYDGTTGLIGCFGNVLGIRQKVDGGMPFETFLDQTGSEFVDVFDRQTIPMEYLAANIPSTLDVSRTALFQAMFTHQNVSKRTEQIGDLSIEMINIAPGGAPTDIRLEIVESDDDALAEINYADAVMTKAGATHLATCFQTFLCDAVRNPQKRIGDIDIMPVSMRKNVVHSWNETSASFQDNGLASDYFDNAASRNPSATAIRLGAEVLTYGELLDRANRIGCLLQAKGLQAGDVVALFLDRSIDMVASILGIWKAGLVVLPLDPEFPDERLAFMIKDSEAKVILTDAAHRFDETCKILPLIDLDSEEEKLNRFDKDAGPVAKTNGQSRSYIIYTSGSTGKPKGVANSHRALCNFIEAMIEQPGMTQADRLLAVTTISFDVTLLELFVPLSVGAELVLASDDDAMDGYALAQLIAERDITVLQGTPATWRLLLDAGWEGKADLKGLCGGEAMPTDLAQALPERIGELWNMYGPTETTVWSTCARIKRGGRVHIGKPIANTRIYILDDRGNPVPPDVAGDLWIAGAGVALGYVGRPELTADKFRDDPFSEMIGERMYSTGDRAKWSRDGVIEVMGRRDEQVKIRGYRIELGDIEAALSAHRSIQACAASVRKDRSGEASLVAYYVLNGSGNPTTSELRRFMRDHLPQYMVPQFFMPLSDLPLTANNKIDRKALPSPNGSAPMRRDVPPTSDREIALAEIWKEVLSVNSVSRIDNFFELGGQSLQAARMIARVHDQLGLRLSPRDVIFETLEQLAIHSSSSEAAA